MKGGLGVGERHDNGAALRGMEAQAVHVQLQVRGWCAGGMH